MSEVRWVIDTAPLVAVLCDSLGELGPHARRAVTLARRGTARIAVPTVCVFEIAQLVERGKLRLRMSFDDLARLLAAAPGLAISPLDFVHVIEARALPTLKDPFDRLIAGTAAALGVPLITRDQRITESGSVRVAW